ncbi:MAG: type II toxin-antitoxin system VapC family toxin [Rubrivivax sp.]|nr:type II toxin-antitoxin system VapC family toxin [Rubrivivax sp.]
MIGVDTNVLIRYLVQDDPRQGAAAARFVERELSSERPGHVSLVVLAETVWVLQGSYGIDKADLIPMISTLAADARFAVQDADALWMALESCEETDADLADALIRSVDALHGCSHTVTFDKRATRLPGMVLLQ